MARKASKVSVYSVAKELGVSSSTVSRVMNNRANVSEKTRQAVWAMLRKYNFKTNYPQSERPRIAIVMCDCGVDYYIGRVLTGIHTCATSNDLNVTTILYQRNSKQSLLEILRAQQCSGVLLLIPSKIAEQIPELTNSGLPIMLIDEPLSQNSQSFEDENPYIGFIDNDSYTGAKEATRYLIDLGHRNIAFLKHWPGTWNYSQRLQGYLDAMSEAGIKVPPEWTRDLPGISAENGMRIGQKKLHIILNGAPEITAILSLNDELAAGAMTAVHERGLKVPEDLSIIGFDNNPFTEFLNPPLTTVHHPCEETGKLATKAIAEFMNTPEKKQLPRIVLPTHLVMRNSTAPVKKKL